MSTQKPEVSGAAPDAVRQSEELLDCLYRIADSLERVEANLSDLSMNFERYCREAYPEGEFLQV